MKKAKHFTSKIAAILIAMTLMVSTLVSTTASAATAATTVATATAISGKLSMDTRSYTLAPGKIYDFRAKIEGTGVKQADVTVSSSRDAIASVHRNTNSDTYRVTGL